MSINWDYYSEIAHKSSATEVRNEDGSIECKQNSFSIDFFYANQQESRLNPITKAFLEPHNNSLPQYEPVTGIEEIKDFFSGFNKKPNEAQYEAILHAINDSVSIIQGPPGTGKTDTIVNILRMLFHLYPATNDENTRTAAIVSNNSEAVENIHAALNESNEPFDIGLKTHFTKLGNSNVRKEWVNQNPDKAHLFNSISKRFNPELLRFFPFFTSTIHSLRRNFSQGFDNQFDYVIIDECSQSSIHLGLMAMSCAKHLVLLGDNKQLSAIIGEKVQNVSDNFENISYVEEQYREKEEWNFLSACDRVFRGRIHSSFLNEHYRCHPSIIDFCNRYVYDDRLIVRTARSNGNDFRMRAVWYEGDYYERTDNPNMDAGGAEGRENNNGADCYGNCNIRQIRIFLEEELPRYLAVNEQHLREMNRLHPELEAKNLSVAIISPFRAQLNILKEELNRLQIEAQLEDENPIVNKLPCLTIHKAQGKGYDIVYLMTVADSDDKTGIWAQRMRMINVAVSRAKKEFCIITSSRWLPPETQKELTGYVLPVNSKPEDEKNNLFFCKLLEYVAEKCPEPQEDYGLHKSPLTSIFDKVPLYRLTGAAGKKSAPERCMYEALTENFGDEYTIYSEVPLKCVEQLDNADIDNSRLADYIEKARFDFVLCNGNSVKLIIEVDGSYHRSRNYSSYAPDKSQLDEMKDTIVRDYLVGEDIFMRIPTNGKTDNEIEMIKKKLDMNTTAEITLSAVCSKSTLVSARNDFIYRQYRKFTEKKNSLGEGESLRNYFMDYKNPDNVGYDNEITRAIYHCRYGAAYSFEYSMLFDAILRSFAANNRNGSNLKVYSFGCGSLLEAWSLAYARASLAETNDCYKRIKLSFDGVDCLDWVDKYVPVDDSSADYIQKMLYRQFGGNVNVVIDDIINFAKENFAAGMPFDHNVILFPKVLNHISAVDFNRFLGYLSAASFTEPEYYICISHSRYAVLQGKNDLDKAKRLVGIFKSKGFEVCSDITEITGNSEDFKNNWEGDDSLVKADEKSDPAAYVFHTAIDEGLYDKNSSYIKDINEDFKCPYHVWQTFKELGENEDYKDLHPCCVAHVSQITFQLIRLRRK